MADPSTLAIDIGGTGLKMALLDSSGQMIGERVRVPTPPKPVGPDVLVRALAEAATQVGPFDRVSVGFPGAVREGRVITAPNLSTELWAGFELQAALAELWHKPVRVMNDADVQGFGAIRGKGVEMVLTLGTGAGTSLFYNGQITPHLELAHHPIRGKKDYDQYVGRAALEAKGKKIWNKRVEQVIHVLRVVVNFDHLYLGGGNAKKIAFDLPEDVTIVSNSDGLTGGIALWRAEEATSTAPTPAAEPPLAKAHRTAAEAVAKKARVTPARRKSKAETPLAAK